MDVNTLETFLNLRPVYDGSEISATAASSYYCHLVGLGPGAAERAELIGLTLGLSVARAAFIWPGAPAYVKCWPLGFFSSDCELTAAAVWVYRSGGLGPVQHR